MFAHLMFSGGNKTQTDSVTDQAGCCTDSERQAVPHRVEVTGVTVQLVQALAAPHQMVHFFSGGFLHFLAHFGQLRRQSLTPIKRLGRLPPSGSHALSPPHAFVRGLLTELPALCVLGKGGWTRVRWLLA